MAIAWSRISSNVIANPPSPCKADRRRCGHCGGRQDPFVPHTLDKRKQEVLGARDACTSLNRKSPIWSEGAHDDSQQTIRRKPGQSQTAPVAQSACASSARSATSATSCRGPPLSSPRVGRTRDAGQRDRRSPAQPTETAGQNLWRNVSLYVWLS